MLCCHMLLYQELSCRKAKTVLVLCSKVICSIPWCYHAIMLCLYIYYYHCCSYSDGLEARFQPCALTFSWWWRQPRLGPLYDAIGPPTALPVLFTCKHGRNNQTLSTMKKFTSRHMSAHGVRFYVDTLNTACSGRLGFLSTTP